MVCYRMVCISSSQSLCICIGPHGGSVRDNLRSPFSDPLSQPHTTECPICCIAARWTEAGKAWVLISVAATRKRLLFTATLTSFHRDTDQQTLWCLSELASSVVKGMMRTAMCPPRHGTV